ncbi:MAG: hypothetical protein OES46_12550 [Gammaproteobacteria bacterium]|nr:hypothetical protein [Gammaproteobacteria bacterium]
MATTELLIFLHDAMPELERWQLEERLRMLPGVLTVKLGGEQLRALTLAYDTDRIHPEDSQRGTPTRSPSIPAGTMSASRSAIPEKWLP